MDWAAFALAGVLTYWLRFDMDVQPIDRPFAQLIFGAATVMLLVSSMIYRSWRGGQLLAMLGRVGLGWLVTWGVVMTWLVLTQTGTDYSRLWLTSWAVASLLFSWLARAMAYLLMSGLRSMGVNHLRVLLVGSGDTVASVRKRVKASAWTGYKVVGVSDGLNEKALDFAISSLEPDEVWICQPPGDMKVIQQIMHALRHSTANIRLLPDMGMFNLMNHGMTQVLGLPMLDISSSPMAGFNLVVKWLEDKLLGLLILLLITPVMLGIAVAVKVTSPGPVIFRQKRNGWNGETINVYKFRSMYVDNAPPDSVPQATKDDPRVTPLGRFLRATSLDELPQFINVLQGRMSIVGPRPHAVAHNLEYRELIPRYMLRHKVKPGITGWAQVNGLRGETDTIEKMEARVQADLYYIENWSLWLDLKIIVMTIFKGFVNRNAY
ncbi:MAG: undecaprenyl-phosphate glucose phosphotransferase [Polaromonas sp.]|nr:undecaprenyl-phosphate glucose phosphotransferase [Polaromonas sp.]